MFDNLTPDQAEALSFVLTAISIVSAVCVSYLVTHALRRDIRDGAK